MCKHARSRKRHAHTVIRTQAAHICSAKVCLCARTPHQETRSVCQNVHTHMSTRKCRLKINQCLHITRPTWLAKVGQFMCVRTTNASALTTHKHTHTKKSLDQSEINLIMSLVKTFIHTYIHSTWSIYPINFSEQIDLMEKKNYFTPQKNSAHIKNASQISKFCSAREWD